MINNSNLYERAQNGEFEKIGSHGVPWQGKVEQFNIYKIPLNLLKYNVKNGRIAELRLSSTIDFSINNATYEKIKSTITKHSKKDIERLGEDIAHHGLNMPLILSKDGIIADGNRRYTSISMLLNKEIKPFTPKDLLGIELVKCVVLNVDSDDRSIKSLEYTLQFDSFKKDFPPISRAYSFYDTIEISKLMTIEEVVETSGIKKNSIEKDIRTAKLIDVFLNMTDSKCNIEFAVGLKLDGPVKEAASSPKITNYFLNNKKLWVNILLTSIKQGGDISRNARALIIGKNSYFKSEKTKSEIKKLEKINLRVMKKIISSKTPIQKTDIVKNWNNDEYIESGNTMLELSKINTEAIIVEKVNKQIREFHSIIQDLKIETIDPNCKRLLNDIKNIILDKLESK